MANNDDQQKNSRRNSPFESMFSGGGAFLGFRSALCVGFSWFFFPNRYPTPPPRFGGGVRPELLCFSAEIIQQAGRKAVDLNRREVDTEHLLYAVADSDVAMQILRQFKLKPEDLKAYIDENAPKGENKLEGQEIELTVSPRLKDVFEKAFYA